MKCDFFQKNASVFFIQKGREVCKKKHINHYLKLRQFVYLLGIKRVHWNCLERSNLLRELFCWVLQWAMIMNTYSLEAWSPTRPVSGEELCRCAVSPRAPKRASFGDAGVELYLPRQSDVVMLWFFMWSRTNWLVYQDLIFVIMQYLCS